MVVTAIIERNETNYYMISSADEICDCVFAGYGYSVQEAKNDFFKCVEEMRELSLGDSKEFPDEIEVVFKYDIPSFFNFFDFINVSKFAARAGINKSKMRQYKSGLATASEPTARKIMETAREIGLELQSVAI